MEILNNPRLCGLLVELFATDAHDRDTLLQVVDRLAECSPEERRQAEAAVALAEAVRERTEALVPPLPEPTSTAA